MIDLTTLALINHSNNDISWEILITVFIFFAGYFLNALIVAIRKYRERVLIKKTFIVWTGGIIGSLENYSTKMKSMAEIMEKSNSFQPVDFTTHLFPLEPFSAYSLDRLTEVFIFKLNPNSKNNISSASVTLYNFLSILQKIKLSQDHAKSSFHEYYSELKRLNSEFDKAHGRFLNNTSNVLKSDLKEDETVVYEKIKTYLYKAKYDKNLEQISTTKELYNVILQACKDMVHNSRQVYTTYELAQHVYDIILQINGLNVYNQRFISLANQLNKCSSDLQNIKDFWTKSSIIKWYSFQNLSFRIDGKTEV